MGTYFNMHIIDNLDVNSLFFEGTFNLHACSSFFGEDLNRVRLNDTIFDTTVRNEWVWRPVSSKAMTVAAIYDFLNLEGLAHIPWHGWIFIWRLNVISRVKLFIWKVAHGKLSTVAYLYNLNIGHASICHFCGVHSDTAEHLLWHCRSSVLYWIVILN